MREFIRIISSCEIQKSYTHKEMSLIYFAPFHLLTLQVVIPSCNHEKRLHQQAQNAKGKDGKILDS